MTHQGTLILCFDVHAEGHHISELSGAALQPDAHLDDAGDLPQLAIDLVEDLAGPVLELDEALPKHPCA